MKSIRETIWDHQWAFSRTVILRTAIQTGLFAALGRGPATTGALARSCGIPARGARRLLDALVGMDLLRVDADRFRFAAGAERYLVPGRPEYLGGILVRSKKMMAAWDGVPRAIASGRPLVAIDKAKKAATFYPELAAGLYTATLETATRAARALGAGRRLRDQRILDVAAGSGVWGLSFAACDPGARVTAVDFPAVLRVTRRFVKQNGMTRRFRFLPGDIRTVDFGRGEYDLAFLGQICHSEGPIWTRRLLRKTARSLVPGGRVVIAEFVPNNRRTGPLYPLVFALHMFLMTQEGDTFPMADYRDWLRRAGFGPPRPIEGIRPPATVFHARKRGK